MYLELNKEVVNAALKPLSIGFSLQDVVSIYPQLTFGRLQVCVLNLVFNKILIITNGHIMLYDKLEDFIKGLEPISLVSDETIQYDRKTPETIELHILNTDVEESPEKASEVSKEFKELRRLMFGAREEINEDTM